MKTLSEHFVHVVIHKDHEGNIVNLMDSDPEFSKGHFIPDNLALNQSYLLITKRDTGQTQIISLWDIQEIMFIKSGLRMVVNHSEKKSIPQEMNDIADAMDFGRFYTHFNLTGLVGKSQTLSETFLQRH